MTIANAGLGDEYTVTVRLKNTMTEEQAKSLPAFITGNTEKGTMQPRLFLMAPEGGAITSLAYESGEMVSNGTVEDRQFINLRLTQGIKPGETVTIAFTVRAAEKAKSTLDVVTTPIINEKASTRAPTARSPTRAALMCRMRWRTSGRELAATAPRTVTAARTALTVANPPARPHRSPPTRTRTPPTPPMEVRWTSSAASRMA